MFTVLFYTDSCPAVNPQTRLPRLSIQMPLSGQVSGHLSGQVSGHRNRGRNCD